MHGWGLFYNWNGDFSIKVQAVVYNHGFFWDAAVGIKGSVHNAGIWQYSAVRHDVVEWRVFIGLVIMYNNTAIPYLSKQTVHIV